jgi:sulfate adenylyltransferase subunit 1 (EFTu-like GTPase family)
MSLPAHHPVDILRFNTCGSVDDGKSTLIGRLLYDSKSLMEDQLEALERSADITGGGQINLANLTDGLRAEREQGITIDVAYRYFATPRRKFIIADTPGHVQYTRNMVTGASSANLSVVLVDARTGVIEQSRRHTCIASLLRIPHLAVAINKMDLVDWSEERFEEIRDEFEEFLPRLDIKDVRFIPISALNGDNVVKPSRHTPWYSGPTLLNHLETVHIGSDWNLRGFRLPVQWVNRPHRPAGLFRRLRDQPADRLFHPDRTRHQRDGRRRPAPAADGDREARRQRLFHLKPESFHPSPRGHRRQRSCSGRRGRQAGHRPCVSVPTNSPRIFSCRRWPVTRTCPCG